MAAKKPVSHTTGPWHYDDSGLIYHLAEEGECRHVARVSSCANDGELERRQNMANAALLVTAPELLAALEAVLPLLPTGNLKACDEARLAVARAKGEA